MNKCHKGDHQAIETNHKVIDLLQEQLAAANHDYSELMKERADYIAENKMLKEDIDTLNIINASLNAVNKHLKTLLRRTLGCVDCYHPDLRIDIEQALKG